MSSPVHRVKGRLGKRKVPSLPVGGVLARAVRAAPPRKRRGVSPSVQFALTVAKSSQLHIPTLLLFLAPFGLSFLGEHTAHSHGSVILDTQKRKSKSKSKVHAAGAQGSGDGDVKC